MTPFDEVRTTQKAARKSDGFINFSFGGDEGDRTPDLLNAIQALSRLSYAPNACDYKPVCLQSQAKKITRPKCRAGFFRGEVSDFAEAKFSRR